jgi:hypothetical protein
LLLLLHRFSPGVQMPVQPPFWHANVHVVDVH